MYQFGQYVPCKSYIHDLDPRVKIIAVVALSIIILQVDWIGLLGAWLAVLAFVLLARLPVASFLKTLGPVLPFFFCLFLLYVMFTPGRPLPLPHIGPFTMSYEGLFSGSQQVGKFLLLVASAAIFTMTTPQTEITMGLERLLRPIKITGMSSHDAAMMLSLALRFMPTLVDAKNSLSEAQLARGANIYPNTISGRIRAINYLAGPLSLDIIRRCDGLVDAMEARGYQQGPRTYLRQLSFGRNDYITLIIIITLFFGSIL